MLYKFNSNDNINSENIILGVRHTPNDCFKNLENNDIELFIKEIDKSVKDMDGCIKMCSKTLDTMRVAKEKLFTRLTNYKNGSLVESGEDEEVEKPTEGGDGKCKKIKSGGNQCGYKAQPGLDYCKRHI